MKPNIVAANDSSIISRIFFLPYLIQMFKMVTAKSFNDVSYPMPRFTMFQFLPKNAKGSNKMLILEVFKKFKVQLLTGLFITVLYTCLSLFTPYIIKEFFAFMKEIKLQVQQQHYISQKFAIIMLLKALSQGYLNRWSNQTSIRVQALLSAQIVNKVIKMQNKERQKITQNQILYLENVDLKFASKIFTVLWMLFDIPVTLLVAIFLMFQQNMICGFVGLFWIGLAFAMQRWIGSKLIKLNIKKFKLIQKRSEINYQLFQKIRQIKLDHSQSILVQKNNDCFINQNQNQLKYDRYQSIFFISSTLLPLLVVCTDLLLTIDATVQDSFVLLSMMALCYKPLRNYQKLQVIFHQGLHSFEHLQNFLNLPDKVEQLTQKQQQVSSLHIKKGARSLIKNVQTYSKLEEDDVQELYGFQMTKELYMKGGQRLIVLGKGSKLFLKSLIGQIQFQPGSIDTKGSIAYLPQDDFLTYDSVLNNIRFYNPNVSIQQIQSVAKLLGLDKDLQLRDGLNQMVQYGKFTQIQYKKIGIARVLCSEKKIYIMHRPFIGLSDSIMQQLQKYFRFKQKQGVMIVLTQKYIRNEQDSDKIMVFKQNKMAQLQTYKDIRNNKLSLVHSFKIPTQKVLKFSTDQHRIIKQFQSKVRKMVLKRMANYLIKEENKEQLPKKIIKNIYNYSTNLKKLQQSYKESKIQTLSNNYQAYLKWLLRQLPRSQWIFAASLILSIECLLIFVQYEIGIEYKKGDKKVLSVETLVTYELILTLGLALLIFLRDYVTSLISIVIGNRFYETSLNNVSNKHINMLSKPDFPLLANRYNRDYRQNFSAVQHILNIFKQSIVVVSTIILIEASIEVEIAVTVSILLFFSILLVLFRKAEEVIIKTFPIYQFQFLKIYSEINKTVLLINIFNRNNQSFEKAKQGCINNLSYKLASNNVRMVQTIICEFLSIIIIALALEYGTIIKIKEGEQNEALIAVSVMLLLNLQSVLKRTIFTAMKLQTLIRQNLMAFLSQIELSVLYASETQNKSLQSTSLNLENFTIDFNQMIVKQENDTIFQIYPFSLSLKAKQKIILMQQDKIIKQNLLLSVTKQLRNYEKVKELKNELKIGGVNINNISIQKMREIMAIIMDKNFIMNGTIQYNLKWRNIHYDQKKAQQLLKKLGVSQQLSNYELRGLSTVLDQDQIQNDALNIKLAIVKAILRKPKVIIVHDIPWLINKINIAQLIHKQLPDCIILGITHNLVGTQQVDKIILLDKMKILQDSNPKDVLHDKLSRIGDYIRETLKKQKQFMVGEDQEHGKKMRKRRQHKKPTKTASFRLIEDQSEN